MTEYVLWNDPIATVDEACKLTSKLVCPQTGRTFWVVNWQSNVRTGEPIRIKCGLLVERESGENPEP